MVWEKLLFMHWPVAAPILRPLIPKQLTVDTFDGQAWIGLVPFTMTGIRASGTPAFPWISAFHELNVRTYVHLGGAEPGVWFFSLDAARLLAVLAARAFFFLPYHHARMRLETHAGAIRYSSRRFGAAPGTAFFRARYHGGRRLPTAQPETLVHFLTARHCLYARSPSGRIYRTRIFHDPWELQEGHVADFESDLSERAGIGRVDGEPLLHYSEALETWAALPHACA
jgi:uncharacterized protein YqjF (DUF2071 family)